MCKNNNVVTDSRMMVFDDGSAMMVIASFIDDKCQGITLMMEDEK